MWRLPQTALSQAGLGLGKVPPSRHMGDTNGDFWEFLKQEMTLEPCIDDDLIAFMNYDDIYYHLIDYLMNASDKPPFNVTKSCIIGLYNFLEFTQSIIKQILFI